MSVPSSMTTLNFSGVYTHNKSLTDVSSFKAMGIPEGVLKAMATASETGTLKIDHNTANGVESITFDYTTATADIEDFRDTLELGAAEGTIEVKGAGPAAMAATRVPFAELETGLAEGWDKDTEANGAVVVTVRSLSDDAWMSKMAQGFQEADGGRRLMRRLVYTTAAGVKHSACLVFDYQGPVN